MKLNYYNIFILCAIDIYVIDLIDVKWMTSIAMFSLV